MTDPRKKQASNSTALVVLGLLLCVLSAMTIGISGNLGGLLFGILGTGLVVAGAVVRLRL